MKSVKTILTVAQIPVLLALAGCATQSEPPPQEEAPIAAFIAEKKAAAITREQRSIAEEPEATKAVAVQIQDTERYLPVQTYDEFGQKISYIAVPNPYVQQTGVIARESVQLFIQARRGFKAERYDEAEKVLQQLIKQDSTLSGPAVMLAKIAEQKEDRKGAIAYYRQALSINPSNVNVYIGLAKMQRVLGLYKQAQNTYVSALAVWKDFPEAHANLAVLYDIYLNKPRRAQQHMEAYQFLTGGKNQQVSQWLDEIKQRTGIVTSFIDKPPASVKVQAPLTPVLRTPGNTTTANTIAGEET